MPILRTVWLTLLPAALIAALVFALTVTKPPEVPAELVAAADGVGDPYFPEQGGSGYDVQHYDVEVTIDAVGQPIRGRTTLTALATENLDAFHIDLALVAGTVTVNNRPASVVQEGVDLRIQASRTNPALVAIRKGETFSVVVEYQGDPALVRPRLARAYYPAPGEFMIVGEPEGATLWFPANDHPSDPATMQFALRVPSGTEGIAAGRLLGHAPDPDDARYDRWRWRVDTPTPTYATFLGFGQYDVVEGRANGRQFVYAVSEGLSEKRRANAMRWLRTTPDAIRELEEWLGPYPLTTMGGFVPATDFQWGGIEAWGRPVYNNRLVGAEYLVTHELAHMWFGDTATLKQWNDMFNNESLTSYAEWLTTSGVDPQRRFDNLYHDTSEQFWEPPLSDPGVDGMFTRVYDRGPTVVHALRTRMGDRVFRDFYRNWAQRKGPHSLEEFRAAADAATPEDLTGFFTEWLDQTDRPAETADNGVRR